MSINIEAADLLDNAADWLEENRWTRGQYRNPQTGGCCGMGALRIANGGEVLGMTGDYIRIPAEVPYVVFTTAEDAVNDATPHGVPQFNDGCRDKRKVVRLFRRTARKLRAA